MMTPWTNSVSGPCPGTQAVANANVAYERQPLPASASMSAGCNPIEAALDLKTAGLSIIDIAWARCLASLRPAVLLDEPGGWRQRLLLRKKQGRLGEALTQEASVTYHASSDVRGRRLLV